jgi:hypothetical protein
MIDRDMGNFSEYNVMSPRERNSELKALIGKFPATSGFEFVPTNEFDSMGEEMYGIDISSYQRRANSGLKDILFARIIGVGRYMETSLPFKMVFQQELEQSYKFGLPRQPEEPIEQTLLRIPAWRRIAIIVDAEDPESEGAFTAEGGRRIDQRLFKAEKAIARTSEDVYIESKISGETGLERWIHYLALRAQALSGRLDSTELQEHTPINLGLLKRWERELAGKKS